MTLEKWHTRIGLKDTHEKCNFNPVHVVAESGKKMQSVNGGQVVTFPQDTSTSEVSFCENKYKSGKTKNKPREKKILQGERIHAGNVDNYIGCQVMYKTKGIWEISVVISVAIKRGSILISNDKSNENTTHKMRLNIPRFRECREWNRHIYAIL